MFYIVRTELLGWFTCVRASGVLDATEVPLGPDALRVVSVGQLQASGVHVVEGHEGASHTLEVLQATVRS